MLHLLDDGLESFLRAELGQSATGLDVSFALPDKEWAASVNRPTLNLLLSSVNPASPEAGAGIQHFEENGERRRRPALPRMAFTYLVTAWVTDVRDEHRLLGAVLATLARPRTLDPPHLPDALRNTPPPTIHLDTNAPDPADLWPAIGGRFHPTLNLVVAASVDSGLSEATAPPPAEIGLAVVDRRQPKRRDERSVRVKTGDAQ
ncbi:MAG TPA: Pvc16 family protein [Acidimicrobiia bacterium]|nr:Pvc16 family protein [Acidimicrobiia bacterium]